MFVLGLRQIQTKSGRDTLSTFQEILNDIDACSKRADNEISNRILTNIVATMSDRAATEQKFHDLLQNMRADILPLVYENWDVLSSAEQVEISRLMNFLVAFTV